ncbi:MAG: hypothetical protein IIZ23_02180 [Ruminococcus sp.]|nr:hypothetical protein [Ruminococcus sp.]
MKHETTRTTGHERMIYLNMIAELKAEHEKELRAKDEMIRYYARTAELATARKKQAIRSAERKAKLNFSYALLLITGMTVIPWLFWFVDLAAKNFWLWAN